MPSCRGPVVFRVSFPPSSKYSHCKPFSMKVFVSASSFSAFRIKFPVTWFFTAVDNAQNKNLKNWTGFWDWTSPAQRGREERLSFNAGIMSACILNVWCLLTNSNFSKLCVISFSHEIINARNEKSREKNRGRAKLNAMMSLNHSKWLSHTKS